MKPEEVYQCRRNISAFDMYIRVHFWLFLTLSILLVNFKTLFISKLFSNQVLVSNRNPVDDLYKLFPQLPPGEKPLNGKFLIFFSECNHIILAYLRKTITSKSKRSQKDLSYVCNADITTQAYFCLKPEKWK